MAQVSEFTFYQQLADELAQRQRGVDLGHPPRAVQHIHPTTFAATPLGSRIPGVLHPALLALSDGTGEPYIRCQTFEAGEEIIHEGELGREFYMLVQGRAEIKNPHGLTIAELGKGECFGELAVLKEERSRMASAVARSRCVVIVVNADFANIDGRLKILFKNVMLDIVEEKLFNAYRELRRLREQGSA